MLQEIMNKILTKSFWNRKLLNKNLTPNQRVLIVLARHSTITKKKLDATVYKALQDYKLRMKKIDAEFEEELDVVKKEAKEVKKDMKYSHLISVIDNMRDILKESENKDLKNAFIEGANELLKDPKNINKQEMREFIEKYRSKINGLEPEKKKELLESIKGEKLLKHRIENAIRYEEVQRIKAENEGRKYMWISSSAENPDPLHQLLYGRIFLVGEGDSEGNMPGERYGCQCDLRFVDTIK
ncbi:MAG: phage head morphogenesis protein [Elusimicrobiota bacterium]|jgi:uncharacterized protein (DUF2267 family)|nr:phage head morphogenesis protein [Elusimicrobiota bacterium]